MPIKLANPFRVAVEQAGYFAGQWVTVAQTLSDELLIRAALSRGQSQDVLDLALWPAEPTTAGPTIWTKSEGDRVLSMGDLQPSTEIKSVRIEPFVAQFVPPYGVGWMEPIQAFVLHWGAWPEHSSGGSVVWRRADDDGGVEKLAEWFPHAPESGLLRGTLRVRRDLLMAFLALFELDLFIYHSAYLEVAEDLEDSGSETNCVWATRGVRLDGTRLAHFRANVLLQHPALDSTIQSAWQLPSGYGIEFPVGCDPFTGAPVRKAFKQESDESVPVFFNPKVLEHYYSDPERYTVDTRIGMLVCRRGWFLPFGHSVDGSIHVTLGAISKLPPSAQHHWLAWAVLDDSGIAPRPSDASNGSPVAALREQIFNVNRVAIDRYSLPLYSYSSSDNIHAQSFATLRVPANNSVPAFQEQLRVLALLVIDFLNASLLDEIRERMLEGSRPSDRPNEGSLNRLARLYGVLLKIDERKAREELGGLFAIQALRSTTTAHRTGAKAEAQLARAEVSRTALPEGFARLVMGALESLKALERALAI